MSAEVEDLRGVFVKAGDIIAYAATDGRSGGLRVGKVLEVVLAHTKNDKYWGEGHKVPDKLKVEVEFSSGHYAPGKPTIINAEFKRFVRIG